MISNFLIFLLLCDQYDVIASLIISQAMPFLWEQGYYYCYCCHGNVHVFCSKHTSRGKRYHMMSCDLLIKLLTVLGNGQMYGFLWQDGN